MPDLEQQLAELAGSLDWPATPQLAGRVRYRLAAPRGQWLQTRWAITAAALIVAATALVAYTPTREAIASWINVHVRFYRVGELPTPSPLPPGPIGARLHLGNRTTLANAQVQVTWTITVPSGIGQPDEVYLQLPPDAPTGGEVTLVYSSAPGIAPSPQTGVAVLITEVRGSVNANYFGKLIGPEATLEAVSVGGHDGYWISGAPHAFLLTDSAGNTREETLRLAGNTLILDDNGTIIRIEGNLTKAQALEIAQSLG